MGYTKTRTTAGASSALSIKHYALTGNLSIDMGRINNLNRIYKSIPKENPPWWSPATEKKVEGSFPPANVRIPSY